jgi:DNA polymerase-3 subunit delta'
MTTESPPESDRIADAPHPRETADLIGQDLAESGFLDAFNAGRLHHGWLLTGPKGVGKSTLAWRIARFLLTQPKNTDDGLFGAPPAPTSLAPTPDHPALARIMALSDPSLFLLRTPWDDDKKRFKQGITVDEVRKLKSFFQMSAADGGRRVVIVDAADDLNINAANALLKFLEEPPADTTILLISHQPSRLLPTIRSRCRELKCRPLSKDDLARATAQAGYQSDADRELLAVLAGGSVGQAIRLAELGGPTAYATLLELVGQAPRMDRQAAIALAEKMAGRNNVETFELMIDLVDILLSRVSRAGLGALRDTTLLAAERPVVARLCTSPFDARKWASLQQELGTKARRGRAVNLDPAALILDTVLRINQAAAEIAA